ncbi:hypothetical protein B9Z19DRAFT_1082352 [Tuber borchii]|uniref:Uncharacterized protein n=1 Tax=Tuber borchii TaxID=42251 RepID=A0A2T6ZUM5_TUBBO|nr:hypothetical protein B9Z19DRAFT_1082352 [Tuber borchii]
MQAPISLPLPFFLGTIRNLPRLIIESDVFFSFSSSNITTHFTLIRIVLYCTIIISYRIVHRGRREAEKSFIYYMPSIYLSTREGCCMWIKLGIDNTQEYEGCGIICFCVTVIVPTGRVLDSGKKYRYPHTGIREIYGQSSVHICARKQTKSYPQCSSTWQCQYFLPRTSACAVLYQPRLQFNE